MFIERCCAPSAIVFSLMSSIVQYKRPVSKMQNRPSLGSESGGASHNLCGSRLFASYGARFAPVGRHRKRADTEKIEEILSMGPRWICWRDYLPIWKMMGSRASSADIAADITPSDPELEQKAAPLKQKSEKAAQTAHEEARLPKNTTMKRAAAAKGKAKAKETAPITTIKPSSDRSGRRSLIG